MLRRGLTLPQVLNFPSKTHPAEVLLSQGQNVVQVSKTLGVTEQTYYRWRKEYGGIKGDQARRLKDFEEGLAWHYRQYSKSFELSRAEAEAKAGKKGLWADPSPVPPLDSRKRENNRIN